MTAHSYQAIVTAPGFSLGVQCTDDEITGIDFLEPRPELAPNTPLAAEAVRQLKAYIADPGFTFGLPLRPAGTTFQRRVWEQISAIPSGQTHTYGQLAKSLKNAPRAATGGGLGGFARERGGFLLDVKRWLLTHENSELARKHG